MNMQTDIAKSDKLNAATEAALETTLLNPRFYTTDFDELDAIDVSSVRPAWDKLVGEMRADPRKGHFKKNEDWDEVDWDGMEPELKKELIDFLISSLHRRILRLRAVQRDECAAVARTRTSCEPVPA